MDNSRGDTVASKLNRLLEQNLISDAALARAAGLSDKTVKNVKRATHAPRTDTKRKVLDGLNSILQEMGEARVGPEIFPA